MKQRLLRSCLATLLVTGFLAQPANGFAQTTAFTYQGRLTENGQPANGLYDFRFALFANASIRDPYTGYQTNAAVQVTDGLFVTTLDFGAAAFDRAAVWLDIGVRTNSKVAAFVTQSPRQQITSAPWAVRAGEANQAALAAGVAPGSITAAALAPGAVTEAALANGAVTSSKLASQSVTSGALANGAVTTTKLAAGSVTGSVLASGVVQAQHFAAGALNRLDAPDASPAGAVTVDNSGLVGVGTTNPVAGLHVTSGQTILSPTLLATVTGFYGPGASAGLGVAMGSNALVVGGEFGGVRYYSLTNPASPQWLWTITNNAGGYSNLSGTFGLALSGNLLAAAAYYSDAVTLFDVSTPATPVVRAQLRDGVGAFNDLARPSALHLTNNLLAVAAANDNAVSLINVANPAAPTLAGLIKNGLYGFTNLIGPSSLARQGNLLAIGCYNNHTVTLADIANPASPVQRSVIINGVGGVTNLFSPRDVALSGNLLAIAGVSRVTLVNVANPAAPVLAGVILPGPPWLPTNASPWAVAFHSGRLWIGWGADCLTAVDVSQPAAPVWECALRRDAGFPGLGSPHQLAAAGNRLVVIGNREATLLDVTTTAPANVVIQDRLGVGTTQPQAPLHVVGNLIGGGAESVTLNGRRVQLGSSIAAGDYATAMGHFTTASGDSSTAMGRSTVASGWASTAMGYLTTASGESSTAMGRSTVASGWASTAMGSLTTASGNYSAAMGASTTASGDYSTAMGASTTASGDYSIAMGREASAATNYALAAGRRAKANHTGAFVWADSTDADFGSARNDEFAVRAAGGVRIQSDRGLALNGADTPIITRGHDLFATNAPAAKQGHGRWGLFMEPHALTAGIPSIAGKVFRVARYETNGTLSSLMYVDTSGNFFTTGAVNPPSDREAKENFAAVDPRAILEKVAALPLAAWNYKNEDAAVRHIGPVAQDFKAAFGVGADDKHIATVDADGVALAAIQGLNQKLEAENAELKERLARLEQLVQQLAK